MRLHVLTVLVVLLLPVTVRAQPLLDAIRANQWAQAEAAAAASADPVVPKLVLYYRLLTAGAARATEIAAFMADSPDWPNQALLSHRLQEALLVDKDDRSVLLICRNRPPSAVPSLLRCADAASQAGSPPEAESAARRAWVSGITDAPAEAAFLKRWGGQLTPEDHWQRFDRLAWSEAAAPGGAAARQALRLTGRVRAVAEARLALRRDEATAPALFRSLPTSLRTDPALVLELARWYRRAGQDKDAADIWSGPGAAAESAAVPTRQAAFWEERNLLARRLLRANEPAAAYAAAAAHAAASDAAIEQTFLAGWIALRRLADPEAAIPYFTALSGLSQAAITQARAHYWLGRAEAAAQRPAQAHAEFGRAAAWPTTYYGQLAALAQGDDAAALSALVSTATDPDWSAERALAFVSQEPARAAVWLASWGEPRRAKAFLSRLDELAADPAERALAARLAQGLGLPEQAVAIARRAGRAGLMLPGAGWPAPVSPPAGMLEPAVVLGLVRQESSFDVQAQSPVGARGLMQLMPGTAVSVARQLGLPPDIAALTADPDYNLRLGTAYLKGLLAQFSQSLPLAIAGYNAGPGRVQDWLIAQDPAAGPLEMIDWIELIPFNETRNYVQRVIENIIMYRAQFGAVEPHPVEPPRPSMIGSAGSTPG